MRLIPAIDLKDGRCVRLLQGDFAAETRYQAQPLELLAKYRDFGADWLHVVDLDGARDGVLGNRGIIEQLARQAALKLQVGGGLRSLPALAQMLDCGVTRVVVGSAAISHPEQVQQWLEHFGSERVTLAFDVRVDEGGTPRVATHGWRQQSDLSLWDALRRFASGTLKHVLCTDVARDGALNGPNLGLYETAVRRHPEIEWQASGGVRDAKDLRALAQAGATAAISGKALLEQLIPREELQPFLPNA
jgi:phosphoribosylformimino-5-aminoimidazole carboxamide ribotide isomerase